MEVNSYPRLLAAARSAAQAAGELLASYQERLADLQVDSKSSSVDLVSSADQDAEDLIRTLLYEALPEAAFIGEESANEEQLAGRLAWVVDPLDGTSNYLAGLMIWSVSIGLCGADMQPLLGVVLAPKLNREWTAIRGEGSMVNGVAARVRLDPPGGGLNNAMLATGFPYDICTDGPRTPLDNFTRMQQRFHKIRRMGSAAIDLALVAEGTFDGMWETNLKSWDAAAGLLLVREAGGVACRFDGSSYTLGDEDLVCAATTDLAAEIRLTLGY